MPPESRVESFAQSRHGCHGRTVVFERSFGSTAAKPSPLTLQQAVRIALEKNPLRKAAIAGTRVASADVREARSILMPRRTFSETATRGNDPVYVLSSELRQLRNAAM